MRLTTKGRFAVAAMADLAMRNGKGPVTLASISERQKISLSYLEQLFGKLRRRNIVVAVRGPGGGYYLARPAGLISIADIIMAVDEPLDSARCGSKGECREEQHCITHDLWVGLDEVLCGYLKGVNLQQVIDGQLQPRPEVAPVTISKRIAIAA